MWPYTSKFNRHAKNHSLYTDDRVKDTLRSRPSLLSHINHTQAFLIFLLQVSLLLKILRAKLFFDISLTLTKAAVLCTALQYCESVSCPVGDRIRACIVCAARKFYEKDSGSSLSNHFTFWNQSPMALCFHENKNPCATMKQTLYIYRQSRSCCTATALVSTVAQN